MHDREIKNRIVAKMLRKRVIGNKKQQVDTVVGYAVPTHAEGRAKDLVDELVREGVIERYGGGHRSNVRLRSAERAIEYLNDNGGDVPFPFGCRAWRSGVTGTRVAFRMGVIATRSL